MVSSERDAEEPGEADYEAYEERVDELQNALFEAYCAGFAKAAETYGDKEFVVPQLMRSDELGESHFYYWDGRTLPLREYLEQQHGIRGGESDGA